MPDMYRVLMSYIVFMDYTVVPLFVAVTFVCAGYMFRTVLEIQIKSAVGGKGL